MDEGLYLLGVSLPNPRLRGSPLSEEEEEKSSFREEEFAKSRSIRFPWEMT